jgi:hypothetical protein
VQLPPVTVTVKEQLLVLSLASVTLQLTVVMPIGKVEPEGGAQDGEPTPGQLSPTVGAAYETVVPPEPGWFCGTVILAGQVMVGTCVSLTVTVNEQLGPAVVVHVTVVVPRLKVEPEAGVQETVPQLPVVVGAG